MNDIELKIEYVPLDSIKPYKRNAKLHPPEQIAEIAESIRTVGFRDPIGIWRGEIVEGHGRYLAAKELGLETVPVIRLDDMTDDERRAYMLIHNKTTMDSGWDMELLDLELGDIELDMEPFGFDVGGRHEWFDREERDGADREEGNEEYNEFLEKFEPKKTTDDCYTPDVVYNAVADWVSSEYGVKKKDFVRPFYPGGDYQREKYPRGCVVVDNPPFSILAEIVNYYADKGIKFFLFAPTLTLFSSSSSSSSSSSACSLCIGVTVTYENGANVDTSFLTNLEPDCRLRSAPTLYQAVKKANDANLKEMRRELPKYTYPDYVITSTRCGQFSHYGIDFRVSVSESKHIRQLDAQKDAGKTVFGSAYLISEKKKQEKEKAEREKAERWELSPREMEIVKSLG